MTVAGTPSRFFYIVFPAKPPPLSCGVPTHDGQDEPTGNLLFRCELRTNSGSRCSLNRPLGNRTPKLITLPPLEINPILTQAQSLESWLLLPASETPGWTRCDTTSPKTYSENKRREPSRLKDSQWIECHLAPGRLTKIVLRSIASFQTGSNTLKFSQTGIGVNSYLMIDTRTGEA